MIYRYGHADRVKGISGERRIPRAQSSTLTLYGVISDIPCSFCLAPPPSAISPFLFSHIDSIFDSLSSCPIRIPCPSSPLLMIPFQRATSLTPLTRVTRRIYTNTQTVLQCIVDRQRDVYNREVAVFLFYSPEGGVHFQDFAVHWTTSNYTRIFAFFSSEISASFLFYYIVQCTMRIATIVSFTLKSERHILRKITTQRLVEKRLYFEMENNLYNFTFQKNK